MTDTAFEKMLHDALQEAELPDALSKEKVLASLQNVEPIRPVYGVKRYIAAAAAVVILLGLGSVLYASGIFGPKVKSEMFSQATNDEFVESMEPAAVPNDVMADEPKEAFGVYNSAGAGADSVSPSSESGMLYDEEIGLEKGSSKEITLPFEFGNETEICYYDAAGSRTDDPCCSVAVSDSDVSIEGIEVGETVVEIRTGTDTCTIKVSVSEGGF